MSTGGSPEMGADAGGFGDLPTVETTIAMTLFGSMMAGEINLDRLARQFASQQPDLAEVATQLAEEAEMSVIRAAETRGSTAAGETASTLTLAGCVLMYAILARQVEVNKMRDMFGPDSGTINN